MQTQSLDKIMEMAKKMPSKNRDELLSIFRDAPLWLFENMGIKKCEEGTVFVRQNLPVDNVYIMLDGNVRAIDHRLCGIEYDYMSFYPIKVFGSMEILLDISKYQTTLQTSTPCTFLVLSSEHYKKWIKHDINALLLETKSMGNYLLEQAKKERIFLFLNGMNRLFMVFMRMYEDQIFMGKRCIIKSTRQELSDSSGLSVKTINRSIKKMEEDGFIGRHRSKITVSEAQYEMMKEFISSLIDE